MQGPPKVTGAVPLSNVQEWFRNYGDSLSASYDSSARFKHNVTKGGSRESQIIDLLRNLLPQRKSVERNALIVGADDSQTAKFDAALVDRFSWPMLLSDGDVIVAPVDSVAVALEVKSELTTHEIEDIFKKSCSLGEIISRAGRAPRIPPKAAAFAYTCANPNLAFLEFVVNTYVQPSYPPNAICILNTALFGCARMRAGAITLTDGWDGDSIPAFVHSAKDSLLLFFYLLSCWANNESDTMSGFLAYVQPSITRTDVFSFDADFLDTISTSAAALDKARLAFRGTGAKRIDDVYAETRKRLGLKRC